MTLAVDTPALVIDAEFKALIPALSPEEYAQLEANLLAEGCRDALVTWNGTLIDGHNRYAICQQHGLPFQTMTHEFASREDAIVWIIQNQFGRRNLTNFVRAELALKLKGVIAAKAKANMSAGGKGDKILTPLNRTNGELARTADVSHETIRKVETVTQSAPEPIKEAARNGQLSVDRAYKLTKALEKASPEVRETMVEYGVTDPQLVMLVESKKETDTVKAFLSSGHLQSNEPDVAIPAKEATAWDLQGEIRRAEKEHRAAGVDARIANGLAQIQKAPAGVYSVIYADPPWRYDNSGLHGAAQAHYPTMSTDEICGLLEQIQLKVSDNAVLFLWATNPLLPDALRVIEAWKFHYKTNLCWDKEKPTTGLGFYVKGQHELVMVATRGSFLPSYTPPSLFRLGKEAHSKKPTYGYALIEAMYPNQRYVELFARKADPRDNWTFWGAESHE